MLRVANAPCSWGVLEFDLEGKAVSYQQVLDEIKGTGYQGTELGDWGFMPTEPKKLKAELAARNLELLAAYVPVDLSRQEAHEKGEATAVRTARLLAAVAGKNPLIVLADDNGNNPIRTENAGRIRLEHGLNEAEWQVFAQGAQRIARTVRDQTGLRTTFHHHCAGFVETPAEVENLMSLTDPALLGLCFDTGHYRFGGGDPLNDLRKHSQRIWHIHFKDCHPKVAAESRQKGWDYFESVRHGIFCELGQGDVDFPAVVGELNRIGYYGWIVVEQDVLPGMGTPKASAQRNRAYLQNIGL